MERTLNKSEITAFINSVSPALARETGYHENVCAEFLQSIGFASNWTLWERHHRPVNIVELGECMCDELEML